MCLRQARNLKEQLDKANLQLRNAIAPSHGRAVLSNHNMPVLQGSPRLQGDGRVVSTHCIYYLYINYIFSMMQLHGHNAGR